MVLPIMAVIEVNVEGIADLVGEHAKLLEYQVGVVVMLIVEFADKSDKLHVMVLLFGDDGDDALTASGGEDDKDQRARDYRVISPAQRWLREDVGQRRGVVLVGVGAYHCTAFHRGVESYHGLVGEGVHQAHHIGLGGRRDDAEIGKQQWRCHHDETASAILYHNCLVVVVRFVLVVIVGADAMAQDVIAAMDCSSRIDIDHTGEERFVYAVVGIGIVDATRKAVAFGAMGVLVDRPIVEGVIEVVAVMGELVFISL